MGLCATQPLPPEVVEKNQIENKQSKKIENALVEDHRADDRITKLLLLGTGESGKSTLFKQMITIYGPGFTDDEKRGYVQVIFNNIIEAAKSLCRNSVALSEQTSGASVFSQNITKSVEYVNDMKNETIITKEAAEHIKAIWSDKGIQATYELRSKFQLPDSCKYFLDQIEVVAAPSFLPTQQDIFRSRVRTTGISEYAFTIDRNHFRMVDVGGQRNERKKWIHCFEGVTAVIFVADISSFDQVLFEDEQTNRMEESLNIFEEISNSKYFLETSLILFLNKSDLFRKKIETVSLRVCFPDYNLPNDFENTSNYIREQYEARSHASSRKIYSYVTCATDTDVVRNVFNAVKDIILQRSLKQSGLE